MENNRINAEYSNTGVVDYFDHILLSAYSGSEYYDLMGGSGNSRPGYVQNLTGSADKTEPFKKVVTELSKGSSRNGAVFGGSTIYHQRADELILSDDIPVTTWGLAIYDAKKTMQSYITSILDAFWSLIGYRELTETERESIKIREKELTRSSSTNNPTVGNTLR